MSDYPGQQPDPDRPAADQPEPTRPLDQEPPARQEPEPPYPSQQPPAAYPTQPPQYPTQPPQAGPGYPAYPPPYPQQPQGQFHGQLGAPAQYQYPMAPQRPVHDKAGLALGLGIGGLVGSLVLCGLPLLLCPFAWAIGQRARKDIQRSGGQLDGDGMALAGMICGIVGTVLLVLAVLALIVFGVLLVVGSAGISSSTSA
ncbi:DUF4190 domain-containing protein [Nocardioides terrisoli]|uniref:DUF4190 domain-containing protein n=1 Tax=Nocardioides terrisoli TaxID=3388267 RepID=UPI00287BA002|nr:DUF4190 domain-containing protein [Nocardioides marmorisolisilvae]